MNRLPNGLVQDMYLEIETDTAKKRVFMSLVDRGDHASIGAATAMASKVIRRYVTAAQQSEAIWMHQAAG